MWTCCSVVQDHAIYYSNNNSSTRNRTEQDDCSHNHARICRLHRPIIKLTCPTTLQPNRRQTAYSETKRWDQTLVSTSYTLLLQQQNTMSRARRVARELEDVRSDSEAGITIQAVNDADISHLKGTFHGPPGTPYQGGSFIVDIQIPNDCEYETQHNMR